MEISAETLAAVEHELEVADAIRRDILNECAEISEMSESYESSLSKSLSKSQLNGRGESEASQMKAASAVVKTTPHMMTMADILYKLKKNDIIISHS